CPLPLAPRRARPARSEIAPPLDDEILPTRPPIGPAMRFPRIRVSVRESMLLILIVALVLALFVQREVASMREARLRAQQAEWWQLSEQYWSAAASPRSKHPGWFSTNRDQRRLAARWESWDEQRRQKYAFAARHPWLPIAPDPPEPR